MCAWVLRTICGLVPASSLRAMLLRYIRCERPSRVWACQSPLRMRPAVSSTSRAAIRLSSELGFAALLVHKRATAFVQGSKGLIGGSGGDQLEPVPRSCAFRGLFRFE